MKSIPKFLTAGCTFVTTLQFVLAGDPTTPTTPLPLTPAPPSVAVLATDPAALIGTSSAAFTFIRTGDDTAALDVPFAYSGKAVFGTDFTDATSKVSPPPTSTSLPTALRYVTIPAGFHAVDLAIDPKPNPAQRGNKTVIVTLDRVALSSAAMVETRHGKAEVRLVDDTYNDMPPTVTLTSPADSATFTLPATIGLVATASDTDDAVQKVSFYAEDTFLGSDTTAPYEFSWVNPKPGDYELFARAVDAAGKSTLSQPVHIKVTANMPTVSITAPADKTTVDPHSNVTITVNPGGGVGNLTVKVLWDSTHVLADNMMSPYTVIWSDVPAGKHTVTAKVTDSVGQTATASIQVIAADLPPVVKITSPASGANFTQGKPINLAATVTDPDDSISEVTFMANRAVLGKGTQSSSDKSAYEFTWTSPQPGFYAIQAVAKNSNQTKTTSAPVVISVSRQ
jgi:hypothetical protein